MTQGSARGPASGRQGGRPGGPALDRARDWVHAPEPLCCRFGMQAAPELLLGQPCNEAADIYR